MKKIISFCLFSVFVLCSAAFIDAKAKKEGLFILNDTKETVRVRYPHKKEREMDEKISPGESFSYSQGKAFIYLPSRSGTYEVTIPESRPIGSLGKITLKQIMEAAKQKEHVDPYGYYTEKGKVGDIEIFFEKIVS